MSNNQINMTHYACLEEDQKSRCWGFLATIFDDVIISTCHCFRNVNMHFWNVYTKRIRTIPFECFHHKIPTA